MADKYIYDNAGVLTEREATVTSAGAGNAGDIVALDSSGLLDVSVLPTGVGPEVLVMAASENLTAGNFVNIFDDTGTIKARKADATTGGKPADGFVLANVTAPANATVYLISNINTQLSGLTLGSVYYLSTTAGGVTATAPSSSGNLVQRLGVAHATTALAFQPGERFVKA